MAARWVDTTSRLTSELRRDTMGRLTTSRSGSRRGGG